MACSFDTDPINQLEENLQCTVCLERLNDPRTLPCWHSFCKVCLEDVVKTCRDKTPRDRPIREIPCPNCRTTFVLDPGKQVADMPRNHFICNMVQAMAVLDRGIGVPCSHNCSQSYSVARCVTCEKFLCRECLTDHNKYRGNNGHSVLTMEELSRPENQKKIKDKMYCNEHSGMILKVYCETCDQLICRDCMDFKHVKPSHSCFLVKDVANNYKELLDSNNRVMKDALTEGNAFIQQLTLATDKLHQDVKNIKSQIAQKKEFVAKQSNQMLGQKAENLLKRVDEIHKGKQEKLERQTEETKSYVEKIKTSVQLSEKLVDQGTGEEIISSQKMMLDNANNLLEKREEYFKAPIPLANLNYTVAGKEPLNKDVLRGLENSLGEVNDGGGDPAAIRKIQKIDETKLNVEKIITESHGSDNPSFVPSIWEIDNDNQQTSRFADIRPPFAAPFSETRVKLERGYIEKIQREKEIQNMLAESEVRLDDGGHLIGTWSSIYRIAQSFVRRYIGDTDQNANAVARLVGDEQNGKGKEPVDEIKPETLLVQTLLFRYIITYHHHVFQALEDVSEEIRMKNESKNEKFLTILPRADVRSTFDAAFDEFINFYQKQSEKVYMANKSVRSPVNMTVIKTIGSEFSLIIDVSEESKTKSSVSIYGEKSNVQKALTQLTTKFGQLNDVSSNPITTTTNVLPSTRFSCTLSNNVNVFVYQGDLVEEKVDVIVNPANERLEHCGGVAEAIAKAGGKTIQSESNEIMRKRRKNLVAGEVEATTAGKLPCKLIVHAVGPRRSEHTRESAEKALFAAVMNSLKIASMNDAHSVSIPVISSGFFGISVDFCAKVLFNAVEAFAKDKRSVKGLHEVRFVNIDKSTTDVFVQEMKKRYSANVKKETRLGNSPPSAGNPSNRTTHNDVERQTAVLNSLMSKTTAPGNDQGTKTDPKADSKGDKCTICLCDFTNKKTLHKCGHSFCTGCIDEAFKHQKKCPICSQVYGPLIGNQPPGKMIDSYQSTSLPGFRSCGTIVIMYIFEGGTQGPNHPNPGKPYPGTKRTAYLPDNAEGRKVLGLLKKAFHQKLTFTIGQSSTLGTNDVITWNDIHHKTRPGATNDGYPDPDYLKRVQEELAAKGITE